MPELPEVETIKRILEPQLTGRGIVRVHILQAKVIAYPEAEEFAAHLTRHCIRGMTRRGKFLQLMLESGDRLCLHLRMTGQLLVTPADHPEEKHTHLVLELSDGKQLRYLDQRRFGRFWLLPGGEADTVTGMEKLGLEPDDPALTAEWLRGKLGRRDRAIKELLLDQSIVCGIGNIYSDEILFACGIAPDRSGRSLSGQEWTRLAETIPAIIAWGIETNAMTAEEYLAGKGKEYRNTPDLRVYGRGGKPCVNCGTPLVCRRIGSRSSCSCPDCQR